MCNYCEKVKHIQVSGGGRYAYASIGLGRGRGRGQYSLDVRDGERSLSLRIKHCPMCGRRLVGND